MPIPQPQPSMPCHIMLFYRGDYMTLPFIYEIEVHGLSDTEGIEHSMVLHRERHVHGVRRAKAALPSG